MSIAQKILANPSAYSIEMLTQGVKDGVIPAYIGIPLIQQKTQEKSQAAGMQGAQQGKQPPIAEEVLAKAQQAGGVDQLPSNLPTQGYAHGGIVAFAGGGDTDEHGVQHFEEGGTPFGRWYNQTKADISQWYDQARAEGDKAKQARDLRNAIYTQYGPAAGLGGLFTSQTDAQRQAAKDVVSKLPGLSLEQLQALKAQGPSALTPPPAPVPTSGRSEIGMQNDVSRFRGPTSPGIDQLVKKPAVTGVSKDTGAGTNTSNMVGGSGMTTADTAKPPTSTSTPFSIPAAPGMPRGTSMSDITKTQLDVENKRFADNEKKLLDNLNEGKPVGKPLEDYKKSLQEEALQAGADKEQAKGMAIFKAGLAIMAGTSQHPLENIGKGAMVGAEDWQVANRELKKAQKERQKELAYIAQAERAEDRDDWKSGQQFRALAAERQNAQNRFGTTAILAAKGKDLDLDTEAAKIASQEWSTLAQVNASMRNTDVNAETNRYTANVGANATLGAAATHAGATVAAANIHAGAQRAAAAAGASRALQAAELKNSIFERQLAAKGALTGADLYKIRQDAMNSPEYINYAKQLAKDNGANSVNQPAFQQKLDSKLNTMVQNTVGQIGQLRGATPPGLAGLLADPSISKYLAQ